MHSNSIIAYYEGQFQFSKRECEILGWLLQNPAPTTDRDIKDALRYADMNSVRPRITELIKKGCVEECGRTTCKVTGKSVRQIRVKAKEQKVDMFRDFGMECEKPEGVIM